MISFVSKTVIQSNFYNKNVKYNCYSIENLLFSIKLN